MAGNAERTVLVAVDASTNARNAFDWYMANMRKDTDQVIIYSSCEQPKLPTFKLLEGMNLPADEWRTIMMEQNEKNSKLESDYQTDLIGKKISHKLRFEPSTDKNPGQGIIRVAEEEKADCIVVGTRGLDTIRRTLMGSVSDYVVRHSAVPVVVCPKTK